MVAVSWLLVAVSAGCSAPTPAGPSESGPVALAELVEPVPEQRPERIEKSSEESDEKSAEMAEKAPASEADKPAHDAALPGNEKPPQAARTSQRAGQGGATLRPLDPSVPLAMPLDQFLGLRRQRIEGLLGAGADAGDGWTLYGQSFALHYERGCAVELVVAMPAGTTCTGPLAGVGFAGRGPPLRRRRACLWPARSIRHSLGKGLAGSLEFASGRFHAQLVGKERKCRKRR